QVGIGQGLSGSGGGEATVGPRVRPPARILDELAQLKALHLSREPRRELAGIEARDWPHAALALELPLIKFSDRMPQRRDRAHAGNDDSSAHFNSSQLIVASWQWPTASYLFLTTGNQQLSTIPTLAHNRR